LPVVTGAVDPPESEHGAVVGVVGPEAVVGDELVVGVVVTGTSVVAVVDGVGRVDVDADLPLPPPHEARIRANAVTRKPYRRTQHHDTTSRFRQRTGTIPAT
jgi:hypothetical protein